MMLFVPLIQKQWVQCPQDLKQAAPSCSAVCEQRISGCKSSWKSPKNSTCGGCGFLRLPPVKYLVFFPADGETWRETKILGCCQTRLKHCLSVRKSKWRFICVTAVSPLESQAFFKWSRAYSETWKDYFLEQIRWDELWVVAQKEKGPAAGADWGPAAVGWMQHLGTGRVTVSPVGHSGRHALFADSVDPI